MQFRPVPRRVPISPQCKDEFLGHRGQRVFCRFAVFAFPWVASFSPLSLHYQFFCYYRTYSTTRSLSSPIFALFLVFPAPYPLFCCQRSDSFSERLSPECLTTAEAAPQATAALLTCFQVRPSRCRHAGTLPIQRLFVLCRLPHRLSAGFVPPPRAATTTASSAMASSSTNRATPAQLMSWKLFATVASPPFWSAATNGPPILLQASTIAVDSGRRRHPPRSFQPVRFHIQKLPSWCCRPIPASTGKSRSRPLLPGSKARTPSSPREDRFSGEFYNLSLARQIGPAAEVFLLSHPVNLAESRHGPDLVET